MSAPTIPYQRPSGKEQAMPLSAERERGKSVLSGDMFVVGQVWGHFVFRELETRIVGLTDHDVYHLGDDGKARVDARMSFRNGFPELIEEP